MVSASPSAAATAETGMGTDEHLDNTMNVDEAEQPLPVIGSTTKTALPQAGSLLQQAAAAAIDLTDLSDSDGASTPGAYATSRPLPAVLSAAGSSLSDPSAVYSNGLDLSGARSAAHGAGPEDTRPAGHGAAAATQGGVAHGSPSSTLHGPSSSRTVQPSPLATSSSVTLDSAAVQNAALHSSVTATSTKCPGAASSSCNSNDSDSSDDFTITASKLAIPQLPMPPSTTPSTGPSFGAAASARAHYPAGQQCPSSTPTANQVAWASTSSTSAPSMQSGFSIYASNNSNSARPHYHNGMAPPGNMASSSPHAGPSRSLNGDGSSRSAAIDVDKEPSRPPSVRPANVSTPKKPVCIGGFMSRAIMLYPSPAVVQGQQPPPGGRWDIVTFRGAEMIKVRLKYRKAGQSARPDEPWSSVDHDTIQVLTGDMTQYIGSLDPGAAEVLIPMLQRGLCRLEGFALRLNPEGPMFEVRINVLMFTLPSNITYIADTLVAHSLFLLDPMPPYDPSRHNESPDYINAHGGNDRAWKLYSQARSQQQGGYYGSQADKSRQVEVQREQVDEVFKSLATGMELEQSDPGPWIKTELFPHQRKALTFLLQGEQDWTSLKQARRHADKITKKSSEKSKEATPENCTSNCEERRSASVDPKEDNSRSLWEGQKDEKGRVRIWKNKITGEKVRAKKGDRPKDAKGAILADDMGLGKTLSVVSLIAATRGTAARWAEKPLEPVTAPQSDDEPKSKLTAAVMTTKVFGMPDVNDSGCEGSTPKGKKRRRDDNMEAVNRRATIIKRSKGTLLVCPMSTITNWEDQIKEHWNGKVEVIGGAQTSERRGAKKSADYDPDDVLRVYIYHGTSRRADPRFLAEFDIVITTYSTLANEYSKQCATCGDDEMTPAETGANSGDESTMPVDSSRASVGPNTESEADFRVSDLAEALRQSKKPKGRKKAGEQPSPLQSIDWFRIVLDEAHSIKSASTVACKASCYLEADRRVALTGTPIQNKIEDVWALFKFLRLSPVNEKEIFNKYITSPCKTGEQIGIARLQLVMHACTLRRTKESTTEDGRKILSLPPRKEIQTWLDLRDDEREIYDRRLNEVKEEVLELKAKKQLTKNYAHVLQRLLLLRQTCNHVDLPSSGPVEEDYDGTIMDYEVAKLGIERNGLTQARAVSVICTLKDTTDGALCNECGADYSPYFPSIGLGGVVEEDAPKPEVDAKKGKKGYPRPILTKCLHVSCQECFKRSVYAKYPKATKGVSRQCGVCQQMLRLDTDIIEVVSPDSGEVAEEVLPKRSTRKKWVRPDGEAPNLSSKMQFLYDDLMRFSKLNKYSDNYEPWAIGQGDSDEVVELDEDGVPIATKSIVFSQWTTMLDRIGDMLDEARIKYTRLDGTMSREARAEAMEELRTKKGIEVMLVSTRAGGVGLNLTSASRAYLVDPYWNPSVEAQAIDRIHRLGQKRPVTAIKLMISHTVEKRLSEIQKKKADLAKLSLRNMSHKELMEQKAEELASLFS